MIEFIKIIKQMTILLLLLPSLGNTQECKPNSISATTPSIQFVDNRDGTVTHIRTGLMWKKCSQGQTWSNTVNGCTGNALLYTWETALKQSQITNSAGGFANYTDWRLPNISEILSISEGQCREPSINLSVFPTTPSGQFCSSSPSQRYASNFWMINFIDGSVSQIYKYWDAPDFYVRLVRGE